MRLQQSRRRYAARFGVAALAAIALGASALPAHADEDTQPEFYGQMYPYKISAGSAGKMVQLSTFRRLAKNPMIVIDVAGMAGVAKPEFYDGCKVAGTKATCAVDETGPVIHFMLTPVAGARPGQNGTIDYTASADNVPARTKTATITLAGSGVDLVVPFGGETDEPMKPGDAVEVPISFYNAGDKPATGIHLLAEFSYGLVPEQYENCEYPQYPGTGVTLVECRIEGEILPGIDYFTGIPFGATLGSEALNVEQAEYFVYPMGDGPELDKSTKVTKGTGKKLTLVAKGAHKRTRAADLDDFDNFGHYRWTNVKNTFDVAAIGATVTGSVGDSVPLRIGLKNNGPAALDYLSNDELPGFSFLVPAGVTVTSAPLACVATVKDNAGKWQPVPGNGPGRMYFCSFVASDFPAGKSYLLDFQVRIDSLTGAPGQVSLNGKFEDPKYRWKDDNPANDTAAVTVTTGDGSGGSGGSGGGLPVTGAKAGLITAGGAALLVAGAALYLMARRRRVVLVAGDDEKTTA